MKKLEIMLWCVVLCMSLGGCIKPMSRGERLTKELGSDQQISDRMMEDIAAALDVGDADALKSLFSKTALEEATDIDQQISDLLEFYQGKKQSFEGDASSSTHTKYGEDIEKELKGKYKLITEETTYEIGYQYNVIDKENPDKEGLISFEIVTEAEYRRQVDSNGYYKWQYANNPGIYVHE